MLSGWLQDLRASTRSLLHTPGLALGAIACMGLGLGGAAAIFSFANGTMFVPMPFREVDRLIYISEAFSAQGLTPAGDFKPSRPYDPHFCQWQAESRLFESFALYAWWPATIELTGERFSTKGLNVTSTFFNVLGVEPVLGRFFLPSESDQEAARVAVLGQEFWRRMYGANPDILGETISLNGEAFTVIGIAPAGIRYLASEAGQNLGGLTHNDLLDFYVPLHRPLDPDPMGKGAVEWDCLGRLRAGVSLSQGREELAALTWAIADGLVAKARQDNPDIGQAEIEAVLKSAEIVRMEPFRHYALRDAAGLLAPVALGVGLFLVIACVNVTSLLLVRAMAGQRDAALRACLGADRFRLMRLCIIESVFIALLGALAGLALAFAMVEALRPLAPADLPGIDQVAVDWRVLVFGFSTAMLSGILVGLVPAWRASQPDLTAVLKEQSSTATDSAGQQRVLAALVAFEVALTVILLCGGGLLLRSYARLAEEDFGFRPDDVVTLRIVADGRPEVYRKMVERVEAMPGVLHAAMCYGAPFLGEKHLGGAGGTGESESGGEREMLPVILRYAGPGYFEALGVPLLEGPRLARRTSRPTPVNSQ